MIAILRTVTAVFVLIWLSGCTTYEAYRSILAVAPTGCSQSPEHGIAIDCRNRTPEHTNHYDLYFVEFDDQGWLHPQQETGSGDAWRQLDFLMEKLRDSAKTGEISLVVYVHGWNHNASADDENVRDFRDMLLAASLVEQSNEKRPGVKARRVIGVYVAWRGKSLDLGAPLTFWDSKFTAQHVAQGSARELFSRLRGFQRAENKDPTCSAQTKRCKIRLLLIGHSFGGLILFNAISESLIDSLAVDEDEGEGSSPVPRFGDMVVLVNPAFEASRYEPLHRIATMRPPYRKYQAPIFVSVTSTADWATKLAFPFGRFFNTIFEHTASTNENAANSNTIGHIPRYITHRLTLSKAGNPACDGWKDLRGVKPEDMAKQLEIERNNDRAFFDGNLKDDLLPDHWTRTFCGGAVLAHTQYNPNSPIWNIQTDKEIIPGHNEISGPVFSNFMRQLYHDTATYPMR